MTAAAYRETAECAECLAREKLATGMHPFSAEGDRSCPECGSRSLLFYRVVCKGAGQGFILKKGFLFGIGKELFHCKLETPPRHFHLRCEGCNHRWMMLTASESNGKGK